MQANCIATTIYDCHTAAPLLLVRATAAAASIRCARVTPHSRDRPSQTRGHRVQHQRRPFHSAAVRVAAVPAARVRVPVVVVRVRVAVRGGGRGGGRGCMPVVTPAAAVRVAVITPAAAVRVAVVVVAAAALPAPLRRPHHVTRERNRAVVLRD